jgi:enoyl-CoA hydratase/carnithine racemase
MRQIEPTPPFENFRISLRPDRIAVVHIDVPGRAMNTLTSSMIAELDVLSAWLAAQSQVRGAVLASAKATGFCVGADLKETGAEMRAWREAATPAAQEAARRSMSRISRALRSLETCGLRVAAGLHGVALGGGLELALACHHRVAADEGVRLAFPEVTLGLLPGAGGTQRTARLVGPTTALRLLTEGRQLSGREALDLGLVDELAPADSLVDAAARWILDAGEAAARPSSGPAPQDDSGARRALRAAERRLRKRSAGCYPALDHILAAVTEGFGLPLDDALELESRHAFETVRTPQATAMVQTMFLSPQSLKHRARDLAARAPWSSSTHPGLGAHSGRSPLPWRTGQGEVAAVHFQGRFERVGVVEVAPSAEATAEEIGAALGDLLSQRKLPIVSRREACGPRLRGAFRAEALRLLHEGVPRAEIRLAAGRLSLAWPLPRGPEIGGAAADPALLAERLLLSVVLEGLRMLQEGVAADPAALDVVAVQGWSFPAWTGGPAAYVDQAGAPALLARSDALAARRGDVFRAPRRLHELARAGGRFYAS